MRKKPVVQSLYTLVRHSAFTARRDRDFMNAVELHSITPKEAERVRAVGGLVFDTYKECDDREYAENYPDDNAGMIPRAKGKFVHRAGIGAIYVPVDTRRFDHRYEPGAYDVCQRCGEEKHPGPQ